MRIYSRQVSSTAMLMILTIAVHHFLPALQPNAYSRAILVGTWMAMVVVYAAYVNDSGTMATESSVVISR